MQFIVIARDGNDPGALERRMKVRPAHLEMSDRMVAAGQFLFGTALLNDAGQMCGSVMVFDFPGREQLDAWLREEPYVTGKVWEEIEVCECKVAPAFTKYIDRVKAAS